MLQIRPLQRSQIAQMLPVLQQAEPRTEMRLIRCLVSRSETRGMAGIMAVAGPDGMIRGGFAYEVEIGSDGTRALSVHHLAIPQLGQARVAGIIERAVESLAQAQNCGAVRIRLPGDAEWEAGYFAGHGHEVVRDPLPAAH
jgi:hypothetical protein